MTTCSDLKKLLAIFETVGRNVPVHTQGQGSNFSVKNIEKQTLLIKPSGYRLDEVRTPDHLVEINYGELKNRLNEIRKSTSGSQETEYTNLLKEVRTTDSNLLASMETGFHALLPKKYVLHFHSLIAIIMASLWEGENAEFQLWLQHQPNLEFCVYQRPGLELSLSLEQHQDFSFIVLARHGVICQSDSENIFEQWLSIEASFLKSFPAAKSCLKDIDILKHSGKMRFFYPDIAVFAKELSLCLKKVSDDTYLWQGSSELSPKKLRNLAEIWNANLRLERTAYLLPEIPERDIRELSKLPSELIRLRDSK